MSTMPSGSDWLGIGLGVGGGALPLLFGGEDKKQGRTIQDLLSSANQSQALSKDLTGQGSEMFRDVIPYIKDLAGGDRQAILQATMPERRRVMDQYDTALKSIAEFSPRSGGTAASMNQIRAQEGQDLATIGSQKRDEGVKMGSDMAQALSQLGLNATQLGDSNLRAIADIQQKQAEQKSQGLGGLGQALGTIAGLFLL
jgi:hypothetical protein